MNNKKISIFCAITFLFQFLIEILIISSSSFFINSVGADKIPNATIISSMVTPLIIFSFLVFNKFKNQKEIKLVFFNILSIAFLFISLKIGSQFSHHDDFQTWFYFIFSNVFSAVGIIFYWNLINDYFYVFESKIYFSYFIISEEVGAIFSDIMINKIFYKYNILQYYNIAIIILFITFILSLFIFKLEKIKYNEKINNINEKKTKKPNNYYFYLAAFYIFVYCSFHFISNTITYQFNYFSGKKYLQPEDLNKFFSEFHLISSVLIILVSFLLNKFFFYRAKIVNQHVFYGVVILFSLYFLNSGFLFYTILVVEMIKLVLEHSLFQTSYEQFSSALRNRESERFRNICEGIFLPATILITGFFLTLFPKKFSFYSLNISNLFLILFTLIILLIFVKKYYYKYVESFLNDSETENRIRSIQALGEKNNDLYLSILMDNYEKTEDKILKKNILISIGKINNKKSIDYLHSKLFNSDEFLQSVVVDSLCMYRSLKVDYLLISFIQSGKNKSVFIRKKVIDFINKNYRNAIVPFFTHLLYHKEERIVANTIENFWNIKDERILSIVFPFLNHHHNRIRANTIILFYNFKDRFYMKNCMNSIEFMRTSNDKSTNISFIFLVGYLRIYFYINDILDWYNASKNSDLFKEIFIENFAFCFSNLNHEIGTQLYVEIFSSSLERIKKSLYKFKVISTKKRIFIIKEFLKKSSHSVQIENLQKAFENSVFDFTFELEVIEELKNNYSKNN